MPYILIDKNRCQIAYSKNDNPWGDNAIEIDCSAPKFHSLKEDYIKYKNKEQWEYFGKSENEKIQDIEDEFNIFINTPIKWRKKQFLPIWYKLYIDIIQAYNDEVETKKIWDISGTDYLELNKLDLTELMRQLSNIYEQAFQDKKNKIVGAKNGF